MVAVKIIVLLFLAAYGFSMGQYNDLNALGKLMAGSFFITAPLLYLLPSIEAIKRGQNNTVSVVIVNVLLGWSLIGWVVAMVMAVKEKEQVVAVIQSAPEPAGSVKACPFCAETVKIEAVKCKHCGSALDTPVAASAPLVAQSAPDDHQATMAHYGIRFADGKYWFGSYAYDKLSDAVNYASKAPKPA